MKKRLLATAFAMALTGVASVPNADMAQPDQLGAAVAIWLNAPVCGFATPPTNGDGRIPDGCNSVVPQVMPTYGPLGLLTLQSVSVL